MIEIETLSKWFGSFNVLKSCSLSVDKGEVVVICGPSGSGKSTLIKCVNGLETFQEGQVTFDGCKVNGDARKLRELRSRIGMVFQNFELYPHLSVLENVNLAQLKVLGRSKADATARSKDLLERVGMAAHGHKFPGQLSGGQQQRVAIARSLAMDPIAMLCRRLL